MRDRQARAPDALARLFLDVTGNAPDDAGLLRMRRIAGSADALSRVQCARSLKQLTESGIDGVIVTAASFHHRLESSLWLPERLVRRAGDAGRNVYGVPVVDRSHEAGGSAAPTSCIGCARVLANGPFDRDLLKQRAELHALRGQFSGLLTVGRTLSHEVSRMS